MTQHTALTAKYRPQTFADVAGQETLKAILSRASLEDKVAAAYLFSGTRGVGKTTIARVFAKALNCRTAPTGEPCNQCDICKAVTAGSAVDVVEIDGASNRGIDDVRRLKEVVGYAPMEGRYKIFIIDEAHMLSREAFNALLKTLEEPPARVTFIMATTEAHKFPATIISRCQHYVFKRLPEAELVTHLEKVLTKEQVTFDPAAVRLIARRGAGSVRDSMSLLGQVLALGGGSLTESSTRNVLGLAGHEIFFAMLTAMQQGDTLQLTVLLRNLLDQGLDIGFFLRELVNVWRNLFMLKQSGAAAIPVVELPLDDAQKLLAESHKFSLAHIHACWQMTLESQRRILTSLEPALALELLLLNLAMLPQILSMEALSALGRKLPPPSSGGGSQGSSQGNNTGTATGGNAPSTGNRGAAQAYANQPQVAPQLTEPQPSFATTPAQNDTTVYAAQAEATPEYPPLQAAPAQSAQPAPIDNTPPVTASTFAAQQVNPKQETPQQNVASPKAPQTAASPAPLAPVVAITPEQDDSFIEAPTSGITATNGAPSEEMPAYEEAPFDADLAEEDFAPSASATGFAHTPDPSAPLTTHPSWQQIVEHAQTQDAPPWLLSLARSVESSWQGDTLVLAPSDNFILQQITEPAAKELLSNIISDLCGKMPAVSYVTPTHVKRDRDTLKQEIYDNPVVKMFEDGLGARIFDYGQLRS